jgi:hypothetical protein
MTPLIPVRKPMDFSPRIVLLLVSRLYWGIFSHGGEVWSWDPWHHWNKNVLIRHIFHMRSQLMWLQVIA